MDIQSIIKRRSKIALGALVGVAALAAVLIVGVSSNNVNAAGTEATVHICTGSYASAYHKSKSCRGLGNCKASVKAVAQSAAIKSGRKACRICN